MSNTRFFYHKGSAGRRISCAFTTRFSSESGEDFDEVTYGATIWKPAPRDVFSAANGVPYHPGTWTRNEGRAFAQVRLATCPITIRIPKDLNVNMDGVHQIIRRAMLVLGCHSHNVNGKGAKMVVNYDPKFGDFYPVKVAVPSGSGDFQVEHGGGCD